MALEGRVSQNQKSCINRAEWHHFKVRNKADFKIRLILILKLELNLRLSDQYISVQFV